MAKQFSESGNQSSSVLTITPTREDDGKHLTCRAENAFVPESSIEDKWRLVVHCEYYSPPSFIVFTLPLDSSCRCSHGDIKDGPQSESK